MRGARKTSIDPSQVPPVQAATLARIARFVEPYSIRALVVVACIAAGAVLNLAPSWFTKMIVDQALPAHDVKRLWIFCAGMIAGPLVAGLLQVAQKYGAESIGQRVMLDVRTSLYRHLHAMPFAFFASQKPGDAVTHVLNDAQGVGSAVSSTLVDLSQSTLVFVSTLAFLIWLDWRLALLAVVLLPLFVTPTRRVGKTRKALKRRVQARVGDLTGLLTETLSVSGALVVKAFGAEEREARRFEAAASELTRLSLEQSLVGRWFQMLLGLFESIGPAMAFAIGGTLVIRGEIPLGTLVAFVSVLKRLYGPASQLAGVHVDLMTSYAYFDRVFAVLDRRPSIADPPRPIAERAGEGTIEFHDVSFAHADGTRVLTDITLAVPAGTKVGIVGPSGAGKSTLAALVMRLYDPTYGSIAIDGVDLRDRPIAAVRGASAIVTQDTFLFHTSVVENLRYANPDATLDEVQAAARRAHIHDAIAAMPGGYDTIVGERGYRLSAGERQRLAIARAILKDPRILILDEATSSLDSASERQVLTALAPLTAGRTSLVIAHRLSTVRDADVILVLDRGRIVERGTHDMLIARNGLYARLWRIQARGERTRLVPRHARQRLVAGRGDSQRLNQRKLATQSSPHMVELSEGHVFE